MENKQNNCRFTKRTLTYCVYVFLYTFGLILTLDHFTSFIGQNDINKNVLYALIIGMCVTTALTYLRVKTGQGDALIVNLKKYKYWAFAKISVFYAVLPLGAIHILDPQGTYLVSEFLFSVFFGLFLGSLSVLYLIRRKE